MNDYCLLCIFNKDRVEAFSDGVFAIIITLLIIDIKVPAISGEVSNKEILTSIISITPSLISWIVSFFTILIIWVNHHRVFELFKRINYGIFWSNAFILLFVCFIPFQTSLMGSYFKNEIVVSFYGISLGMMSFTFYVMRKYSLNAPGVLSNTVNKKTFAIGTRNSLIYGPLPYFVAAGLSWIYTPLAIFVYLLIPVYFASSHSIKEILNL